jgi:hypothetical protein
MAGTLKAIIAGDGVATARGRERLYAAVGALISAGVRTGELRAGARAEDLVAALVGVLLATDDRDQAGRLFDLLVAGLRAGAPAS